jgi:hypothetical protein
MQTAQVAATSFCDRWKSDLLLRERLYFTDSNLPKRSAVKGIRLCVKVQTCT